MLQRGVHKAVCNAAGGDRKPSVDALEALEWSLSVIVGHSNFNELASLGYLFARSANREQRQSRTRAACISVRARMRDTL